MMSKDSPAAMVADLFHLRPLCIQRIASRLIVHITAIVFLAIGTAASAQAADAPADQNWPTWRGPLANGVATTAQPPLTWSETSNVRWKVKIPGTGTSSPIVWGDKVFVQTAIETGKKGDTATAAPPQNQRGGRGGFGGGAKPTEAYQFVILCLDRQTGKELWRQTAREEVPHEAHHPTEGSFASPSPVTDGKHVFAYFGSRGLHCYDMDGKLRWREDFGKMRILLGFGEGSSPALYGELVIVNWDNEDGSFVTALDKNTGKTVWKTPRDEKTAWSTPLVVEQDGKAQVITTATSKIRSYDADTGKLIWECGGLTRNVIPSPVFGDGVLYAMSGYQGNSVLAIRLGRTGDLAGTDSILWNYRKKTPYVPSPLLYEGRLWFFAVNSEIITCLDVKTGKALVDGQRMEDMVGVYASPVAAGGRIYLTGRNGVTVVIKSADKIEVLATNHLDEKFDASPALVGNELFLRGVQYLYCIGQEQSKLK